MDTIFALSSGTARAGVAVIRISGPQARVVTEKILGSLPPERELALRTIRDPYSGETIDQGMVVWFAAPRTATGEDVAEFHLHGSRAVVAAVLSILGREMGCRGAEPGEFTRRAFANGKLDLAQVEGLADLIAAETESQRRAALRHLDGSLSRQYEAWRASLLKALAYVEATIDFSDEDLPRDLLAKVRSEIASLAGEIDGFVARGTKSRSIRDGFAIAIVGEPNVGKSSLLNAIAGREAAIVSERAGTTRDVITVRLDLGGHLVVLSDTAGLRETQDDIEAEGVGRARREAEAADLRLLVIEAGAVGVPATLSGVFEQGDIVVANKADLIAADGQRSRSPSSRPEAKTIEVSARTGFGIGALLDQLKGLVAERTASGAELSFTHLRHEQALKAVVARLRGSLSARDDQLELFAEDLRAASRELGRITGRVDVEDLLDLVFRDFCIGK